MNTTTTNPATVGNRKPTPEQIKAHHQRLLAQFLAKQSPDTVRKMYAYAERATTTALKHLHRETPLDIFRELQNQYNPDSITRTAPAIVEQLDKLKAEKRTAQQEANEAHKLAHHVSITQAERDQASAKCKAERNRAKNIQKQIDTLEATLSNTFSLRADLVQVALEQYCSNLLTPAAITPALLASHGYDPDTDPADLEPNERKELQAHANFRKCISAVAYEVRTNTTPDANTKTTTKPERITPEQAKEWIATYATPDTWESVKVPRMKKRTGMSDCFDTLEHRPATDEAPAGWYIVRHWRTVSPVTTYDIFTDTGEEIEHGHTQNPYISDQAGEEQLAELANRAHLTDRERMFMTVFCNPTARKHGAEARTKYLADWYEAHKGKETATKREQERREQGAGKAEYSARIEYACNAVGVTNIRTQQRFLKSLFSALDGARAIPEPRTPEELAQADRRAWERMQGNRGAHIAQATAERADLVAWTAQTQAQDTAPAIRWTPTPTTAPVTEADREAERKAEKRRRARCNFHSPQADFYRELRDAPQYRGEPIPAIIRPDDTNRHSAKHSAFAFWQDMSESEKFNCAFNDRAKQEQAKRHREAWRNWKSLDFKEYSKLSEVQKQKYKEDFEKLVSLGI